MLARFTQVFAFLFISQALVHASEMNGGSIYLKATLDKPFAVSLVSHTKMNGKYQKVAGPEWISLTEEGVLFGSPTKDVPVQNEFYFSVTNATTEDNFRVVLTVGVSEPSVNKLQLNAKVGQVFKYDLSQNLGKGTYLYQNVPTWLKADNMGLLYGVPEKNNIGVTTLLATMGNLTIEVEISVIAEPAVVDNTFYVRVGDYVNLNVFQLIGIKGYYQVSCPNWLRFYPNGTIQGHAPWLAKGLNPVFVRVNSNGFIRDYRINIIVQ